MTHYAAGQISACFPRHPGSRSQVKDLDTGVICPGSETAGHSPQRSELVEGDV